jgi:trk system potassium uptake protein
MKAIIVGGGKVGYYLFKTLRENRYNVVLIERERALCKKISEEIDGEIICGDGLDLEVLKDADIRRAQVVAAVTGKDEENLIICQMAKMNFNVKKTIARINNPKNGPIFKALGVDEIVCNTEVIGNLIEGMPV